MNTPPTNNSELREILEIMFGQVSLLVLGQQATITDPRNGGVGKMINFYAAEQAKKYEQYIRTWAKSQLPEKKDVSYMNTPAGINIGKDLGVAQNNGYNEAITDAGRNFDGN